MSATNSQAPETVNYCARGKLLLAEPTDGIIGGQRVWIILVNQGSGFTSPYVVSRYVPGSNEWLSGNYCSNCKEAAKKFVERCDLYGTIDLGEHNYVG